MLKLFFTFSILVFSSIALARESAIEAVDTENLRVCADPSNLPFSNEDKQGYENDIANQTERIITVKDGLIESDERRV